jgi:hypothetical protein
VEAQSAVAALFYFLKIRGAKRKIEQGIYFINNAMIAAYKKQKYAFELVR